MKSIAEALFSTEQQEQLSIRQRKDLYEAIETRRTPSQVKPLFSINYY